MYNVTLFVDNITLLFHLEIIVVIQSFLHGCTVGEPVHHSCDFQSGC